MSEKSLKFKILADISDMKKNMKAAGEEVSGFKDKVGKLSSGVKTGFATAAKSVAVVTTAVAAGGAALFKAADNAAQYGDRVDKMSQKLGISKKFFQELDYVMSQNGTSVEALERGMASLGDRMTESVAGSGKGAEAFKTLGVSATDLNGNMRSTEDVFNDTVKAIMGMPDGIDKAQMAADIFGPKVARELAPFLNGTAEDFDNLSAAANNMGLVLSDEAIAASADFADMKDNVTRALSAVTANIGVELMPMFMEMFQWIMNNMPAIQKIIKTVFTKIKEFVDIAVKVFKDHLLPAFQEVVKWVQDNWSKISDVFKTVFDIIGKVWENVLKPVLKTLLEVFANIVTWISDNWDSISAVVKTVFDAVKSIWENVLKPVLDLLWSVFKSIVEWVKEHWPQISKVFTTVFNIIKTIWEKILKPVLDLVLGLFKTIVGWVQDNWETISAVFKVVSDAIEFLWGKILKPVLTFFWDIVKNIYNFVKNTFSKVSKLFSDALEPVGKLVEKVAGFFSNLAEKIQKAWDWLTKWNNTEAKDKKVNTTYTDTYVQTGSSGGGTRGGALPSGNRGNVVWNARGAIFKKPTILNGQGVGDASNGFGSSAEVVAPLKDLKQMLGLDNGNKGNTIINLNGNYGFRDKDDMDYFMNELALAVRRG